MAEDLPPLLIDLSDQQLKAKTLIEDGHTVRSVAATLDVTTRTVYRWVNHFGWERKAGIEDREQLEAARMETQVRREWGERRRDEANNAGLTAARLRNDLLKAAKAGDSGLVRSLSIAYGILIDKAEKITGTLDTTQTPVAAATRAERLGRIGGHLDELGRRREKRASDDEARLAAKAEAGSAAAE